MDIISGLQEDKSTESGIVQQSGIQLPDVPRTGYDLIGGLQQLPPSEFPVAQPEKESYPWWVAKRTAGMTFGLLNAPMAGVLAGLAYTFGEHPKDEEFEE